MDKTLPHQPTNDGRRLMDNYPHASNRRLKPKAALGHIWILLEQDKDRIVSKYTQGRARAQKLI